MSLGRFRQLPPELVSTIFEFAVWSDPYVPAEIIRGSIEGGWTDDQGERQRPNLNPDTVWMGHYDPQMRMNIGLVSKVNILGS